MFSNYLRITFRRLLQHKGVSFITIAGLAIGMASCILILLWVTDELSYNTFNKNLDRIFLVPQVQHYETSGDLTVSPTPMVLAKELKESFPEVKQSTRYEPWLGSKILTRGDQHLNAEIHFADPSFFDIFTFHFIRGDRKTALNDPHSIVLTESLARKLFGSGDALGQTVTIDGKADLKVTGILEDVPHNSDIRFEGIAPTILLKEYGVQTGVWGSNMILTYVLLHNAQQATALSAKIKNFMKEKSDPARGTLFLFPFKELHLYSISGSGGRINQVIIFSIVALFTLAIACANFVNLATARSATRSTEVGIRKAIGASRRQVALQFFSESALLTIVALAIALFIVSISLPFFNEIARKNLSLQNINVLGGLLILGLVVVTSLLAGVYPAFFLSAFQPASLAQKRGGVKSRGLSLKTVLVVVQFAISIALIASTLIIHNQMRFMLDRNIGLDRDNILYFSLSDNLRLHVADVKSELLKDPNILDATACSHIPLFIYSNGGGWSWEGKPPDRDELISQTFVDYDYLATFGIGLQEGRFFSRDHPGDASSSVVVNRSFERLMGNGAAVGKVLTRGKSSSTIIGVVNDFNFLNLHNQIGPLAIFLGNNEEILSLRVRTAGLNSTLAHIGRVVHAVDPGFVLNAQWLDETYRGMYSDEERLEQMINAFALIAIVISCMGLYGVTLNAVESRTKEIGIRKVCGASLREIVLMLSKEAVTWIFLGSFIAGPAAYYFMHSWLQSFAYRTDVGVGVFLLAAGGTAALALLTISYQAVRAGMSNPVEALRYE